MSAKIDRDFVVFLIGMRINRVWKVHRWFPVQSNPANGLLGVESAGLTLIQSWRSFDALEKYVFRQDPGTDSGGIRALIPL